MVTLVALVRKMIARCLLCFFTADPSNRKRSSMTSSLFMASSVAGNWTVATLLLARFVRRVDRVLLINQVSHLVDPRPTPISATTIRPQLHDRRSRLYEERVQPGRGYLQHG